MEPTKMDDGNRCGLRDGKNGLPCILDLGHDAKEPAAMRRHSTGYRTWCDRKPKAKAQTKESEARCLCAHGFSRHRGATDTANTGGCLDCVCEFFETEYPGRVSRQSSKPQKTYKPHPAAALFPMLSEAELDALAADIAEHGQHEPIIITAADLVLDGRNRLEACKRAKVEPEIQLWDREDDEISPTAWVMSRNLRRRHLTDSQKAMVAVDALPLLQAEAKARQKMGGRPANKGSAPVRDHSLTAPAPAPPKAAAATNGKAAAAAGKAVGVSTRIVEQAKALIAKAPKAELEKIRSGEKTIKQVERETKRATQVAQVRVYQPPVGEFAVISADPPWQYADQLDGSDASRGGCPYPTMPLEEICALTPPAAKDCVLWLWTTNAFLADGSASKVVEAWGFESKTILTWVKPRMGLGRWLRNITEHCILAVRGEPKVDLGNQTTELRAPLGAHSAKPEAFYALVEKLCPSPSRIEMFARADRPGWVTSGAELAKKRLDGRSSVDKEEPIKEAIAPVEVFAPAAKKRRLLIRDVPGEVA